nr:prepilin peptidase [Ochrobactrum sp. Marseille-Q0166]
MVFAIIWDARTMHIPNWIPISILFLYFVWVFLSRQQTFDIICSVLVGLALFLVAFLLFAKGIIGGGDGKLIAAVALWLGWGAHLLEYLVIASVLGGILSLAALASRNLAQYLPLPAWVPDWVVRKEAGVPYGVALGIAGLIVLPDVIVMV